MSKLSLELQTDLKNKAINLCCDITKLFDEFNSKKRKTDKSWRNLNVKKKKLIERKIIRKKSKSPQEQIR